jgi:hypothetical protein
VLHSPLRVVADDGQGGLREIRDDVDASLVQQLHALRVIRLRIDGISTDGVDAELLQQRHVLLAKVGLGERILVRFRVVVGLAHGGRLLLVGDTLHEELGAILVEELLTLDVNGGKLSGGIARQREHGNLGKHFEDFELLLEEMLMVIKQAFVVCTRACERVSGR